MGETDGKLHNFVTLDEEGARKAARVAGQEMKQGRYRGALHGNTFTVKYVASETLLAIDAESSVLKHRIFTVSENTPTFGQIADTLRELSPSVTVEFGPGIKEGWITTTGQISIERASKELGYKPKYDIREGLRDFIQRYKTEGNDWYK